MPENNDDAPPAANPEPPPTGQTERWALLKNKAADLAKWRDAHGGGLGS
jgi:hypothetical protein